MKTIHQNHPPSPLTLNIIVIVSGLPRSGTSMVVKVLAAGDMEVMVNNIRFPDQDNPKGYYEYEKVKALPYGKNQWLTKYSINIPKDKVVPLSGGLSCRSKALAI